MNDRILSIALSALREGKDIVVIALDREDAERLAEEILARAAAEGLRVVESIGERYEQCSDAQLVYVRAYEQECAAFEGRNQRPLAAVRHPSAAVLERASCRPPAVRTVFA